MKLHKQPGTSKAKRACCKTWTGPDWTGLEKHGLSPGFVKHGLSP